MVIQLFLYKILDLQHQVVKNKHKKQLEVLDVDQEQVKDQILDFILVQLCLLFTK